MFSVCLVLLSFFASNHHIGTQHLHSQPDSRYFLQMTINLIRIIRPVLNPYHITLIHILCLHEQQLILLM